jgi:hypothetical protein
MTFTRTKKIDNSEPSKGCFWCLVFLLTFCLFSYGYCVRGAIVNIVERQNIESDLSVLNTKVAGLEAEYIKAKSAITPELAANLGFISQANKKFVVKTVNTPGLSLITNAN